MHSTNSQQSLCTVFLALCEFLPLSPMKYRVDGLSSKISRQMKVFSCLKPLNAALNPICHLLALLGDHHILHVSRIRVKGADRLRGPPPPPIQMGTAVLFRGAKRPRREFDHPIRSTVEIKD
jgi:hypothetical protein